MASGSATAQPASNGFAQKRSSDVSPVDAITVLTRAFDQASVRHGSNAADHRGAAVVSWPAVPVEIIRAAGLRPLVVRGAVTPTPAADQHLEPAVFPRRVRQLLEAAMTGQLNDAACIVLPRTSESDYKCFLYLRELVRRRLLEPSAPIHLFDLLQSQGRDVAAYNADRTRALFAALAPAGAMASLDALRQEIARTNAARAAVRRLLALRNHPPRITGAEVLPLIGAFWFLAPEAYASLALAAADSIAGRPPLVRPRVLLLGAPVDGPVLHAAIEEHGAVVVAETSPWGIEAAGEDVADEADPLAAIAEKYRRDASGPRSPVVDTRSWTARALAGVDAVVVSLPPDDAVFGWDYPNLCRQLQALDVPHVCLTHDPYDPVPPVDQERLAALVDAAAPRLEARGG